MSTDPSLAHVLKLAELRADSELVYRCQLCRRQGSREQLGADECPARSGPRRFAAAAEREKAAGAPGGKPLG